jgi:hypothetical protein
MKWSRKLRQATPRRKQAACGGTSTAIDLNDLLEARKDGKVRALLRDAEEESARVAREGRKRW